MSWKRNGVLLISALGAIFISKMAASQAVDQIVAAEERRIQQAQESQDVIDGIVDETRSTTEEYRGVMKEVDGLIVYNTLLDRQIQDQELELSQLRTSIDSVTVIERQSVSLVLMFHSWLRREASVS